MILYNLTRHQPTNSPDENYLYEQCPLSDHRRGRIHRLQHRRQSPAQGHRITIYDNLSRKGGRSNLEWLHENHGSDRLHVIEADIRDYDALAAAVAQTNPEAVIHLAGQVAVTTSVIDPREDFEINALGTFNVLEAVAAPRAAGRRLLCLDQQGLRRHGGRRDRRAGRPLCLRRLALGIPETYPLDFHSPYGCSKGAGDQYMRDYARIYGLRTVVLRQSCIYGPRQFGVEDQGWVAHFVIAAVKQRPITIYGDGKQVRDVLHIDDLVRAYQVGIERIDTLSGEVITWAAGRATPCRSGASSGRCWNELAGRPVPVTYGPWRPGDQHVFVADIRRAGELLGWQPAIAPTEGIGQLYRWVASNPTLFD